MNAVALAVEAISDDSPPIVIVVEQPVTSVVESERQGVAGAQGEQGLSAYEVAVENGFEGTEEEWLESLVFLGVDPIYVNLSGFEFTIDRQNRNTIQVFNSAGYEVSVVVQLTETEFFISSLVDLSGHTAMLSY